MQTLKASMPDVSSWWEKGLSLMPERRTTVEDTAVTESSVSRCAFLPFDFVM